MTHETTNFAKTEEGFKLSEGFVKLSDDAKRFVESGLGDDTVEAGVNVKMHLKN